MVTILIVGILLSLPLAEILVLIEIGAKVGAGITILICVVTAIVSTFLFRIQGFSTLTRAQKSLALGQMPVENIVDGLGLFIAAGLLFIPGFITDFIGCSLFIPPFRLFILKIIFKKLIFKMDTHHRTNAETIFEGEILDGEFRKNSEQKVRRKSLKDKTEYHKSILK